MNKEEEILDTINIIIDENIEKIAKKLREEIRLCSNSNFEITNFFGNDKMILNDLVLSLCNL